MLVGRDDTARIKELSAAKGMVIKWDQMMGWRFDPRYFTIDTSRFYTLMTYDELMK